MTLLDNALALADLDLRVFPLHPLSTAPSIDSWIDEAATDARKISAWWQETPNANIGVLTGTVNNLFVVELEDSGAQAWWKSLGFADGARVDTPAGPDRSHLYFRVDGLNVESSSPRPGVTIYGDGSYLPAPPSVLPTGTIRGDLSDIPTPDFDPHIDLLPEARQRMLPMLDVANRLPESTSTGEAFTDLIFWAPLNETAEEFRATRARVFHEALGAQLTRHEAASLAWGSKAGSELRETVGGLERMWVEIDEAEDHGPIARVGNAAFDRPVPILLLSDQERSQTTTRAWWGSRYVDWAETAVPGASDYHRLHRWLILSRAFAEYGTVPKRNDQLDLNLPSIAIGSRASGIISAREPMSALLQGLRASDVGFNDLIEIRGSGNQGHFVSRSADEALAAWDWTPERLGQFVWAIDSNGDGTVNSLIEDQQAPAQIGPLDPIPAQLATQLADAREQLTLALGKPSFPILMEQNALDRHSALKVALKEILADRPGALLDFANSIRKCATLVAMSEGAPVVCLAHELIAIEQAEEWLGNLMWMMQENEAGAANQTARPANRSRVSAATSYAIERRQR